VNTEITDTKNTNGWVLFDDQCRLCRRLARRWGPLLGRHHFALAALQTPRVRERLAKNNVELLFEMRLLTPQGRLYGGADAVIAIARQIWWAWPLYWLAQVPGVRTALRHAYAWFARRRHCLGGRCETAVSSSNHGLKHSTALNQRRRNPNSERKRSKRVFFEMP
jgi:predicted DCC family thiol-disulfide oxidoreductase YuxK